MREQGERKAPDRQLGAGGQATADWHVVAEGNRWAIKHGADYLVFTQSYEEALLVIALLTDQKLQNIASSDRFLKDN